MRLTVISAGLLTTLQDSGRTEFQASGFSVSGCMDRQALFHANVLVNNPPEEAVLEMQYLGGSFRFEGDTYFALTGADMEPRLNGRRISNYCAVKVKKGDILTCHRAVNGRFAYLAVAGGFLVPKVLGSKSTNMKCQIGGFLGRALLAGDEIPMTLETPWLLNEYRKEADSVFYETELHIRVIAGPQERMFTKKGLEVFYREPYIITEESDRMGYRLKGTEIESKNGVDIISDGIVAGSIQVSSNGMPMILLADRQTTGGYAKIATVISVDIPKLVQSMPGTKIQFEKITLEEAVRLYRKSCREQVKFQRTTGYCEKNMGFWERRCKGWKKKRILS